MRTNKHPMKTQNIVFMKNNNWLSKTDDVGQQATVGG